MVNHVEIYYYYLLFINMDFLLSGMAHHLIWCNMESEFHQ